MIDRTVAKVSGYMHSQRPLTSERIRLDLAENRLKSERRNRSMFSPFSRLKKTIKQSNTNVGIELMIFVA